MKEWLLSCFGSRGHKGHGRPGFFGRHGQMPHARGMYCRPRKRADSGTIDCLRSACQGSGSLALASTASSTMQFLLYCIVRWTKPFTVKRPKYFLACSLTPPNATALFCTIIAYKLAQLETRVSASPPSGRARPPSFHASSPAQGFFRFWFIMVNIKWKENYTNQLINSQFNSNLCHPFNYSLDVLYVQWNCYNRTH